jgi:predicted dehydrogenase
MVGCGGFQRYRIGNLKEVPEAAIVAFADPSSEQIELTVKRHPDLASIPAYSSLDEMVDHEKLDAIMIATPHTQHVGQILTGFAHGLHVCCEKPLVTSVADAHKIIAARDKARKVGMVSYQRHFDPTFRFIRSKIQSGEAGKVTYVQVLQGQEWLRATKGTWRQQHALSGGGQLNDSGSHVLDITLWVSGLSPRSVVAFSDDKGTEVDIDTSMSVLFQSGAMGSYAIVGDALGWYEDITFFCEKMSFFVRQGSGLTIMDEKQNRLKAENLTGGSTPDRNFIHAVLGKAECESPFECGLEVIRLTEAAWASAADGGQRVDVIS